MKRLIRSFSATTLMAGIAITSSSPVKHDYSPYRTVYALAA